MASGYIEYSNNTGTAFTSPSAYTIVALTTPAYVPYSQMEIPSSGVRWSHIEVVLRNSNNNNSTETVKIFLSWDSIGLYRFAGPSTALTIATGTAATSPEKVDHQKDGGTAYDYLSFAMDLGISGNFPGNNNTFTTTTGNPADLDTGGVPPATLPARGTVYLGMIPNAAHSDQKIILARLHWYEG